MSPIKVLFLFFWVRAIGAPPPIKMFLFGLAYQGKEIVLRFIVEYGSLNGFGP
jgi:hypothetical protein